MMQCLDSIFDAYSVLSAIYRMLLSRRKLEVASDLVQISATVVKLCAVCLPRRKYQIKVTQAPYLASHILTTTTGSILQSCQCVRRYLKFDLLGHFYLTLLLLSGAQIQLRELATLLARAIVGLPVHETHCDPGHVHHSEAPLCTEGLPRLFRRCVLRQSRQTCLRDQAYGTPYSDPPEYKNQFIRHVT